MLRLPSKNNLGNIRELFGGREPEEKVPPDLRRALNHLRLNGFEDLEERFLCADAFLKPWAVFRDSIFLLSPNAMPCPTKVLPIGQQNDTGVSRMDLLWFYTNYDEGTLRYDPRADRKSVSYTPDTSVYGQIDKSNWRPEDYEKHLYAWLLQEFKVGKARNPWGFEYFQLKNVCTAWEEVLVPIVNAVRTSYSLLGRRYYGRLALYIEARSPSTLAFPGSNVDVSQGGPLSPTPYRIVSVPKKKKEDTHGVLSKKHYDATEKELRDVYPQYGGLVERPKFKHKMEEWLAEQRARAHARRGSESYGNVQSFQPKMVHPTGGGIDDKPLPETPRKNTQERSSESPIKRYSASIKRSLSTTMSSLRNKDEMKSPLHGVTRPLHFPDPAPEDTQLRSPTPENTDLRSATPEDRDLWPSMPGPRLSSSDSSGSFVFTPLPRPPHYSGDSDDSECTTLSEWDRRAKEVSDVVMAFQARRATSAFDTTPLDPTNRAGFDESELSPMAHLSAIPRPLNPEPEMTDKIVPEDKGKGKAPDRTGSPVYETLPATKFDPASEGKGKAPVRTRGDVHETLPAARSDPEEHRAMLKKKPYHDVRVPSYEGSDWQQEIDLSDIYAHRIRAARSPERGRAHTPATRLPAPIIPVPYSSPRVASADKPSKPTAPQAAPTLSTQKPLPMLHKPLPMPPKPFGGPPKPMAQPGPSETLPNSTPWPDSPSPKKTVWPEDDSTSPDESETDTLSQQKIAWPGADSDEEQETPPLPSKSPERQIRNPRSRRPLREDDEHEVFRIVSRENIRTALSGLSRESSAEELAAHQPFPEPARTMSPMQPHLQTYNTHMFPRRDERKGTPVGAWIQGGSEQGRAEQGRAERGESYELQDMEGGKKGNVK
jgi:hypothetical protein